MSVNDLHHISLFISLCLCFARFLFLPAPLSLSFTQLFFLQSLPLSLFPISSLCLACALFCLSLALSLSLHLSLHLSLYLAHLLTLALSLSLLNFLYFFPPSRSPSLSPSCSSLCALIPLSPSQDKRKGKLTKLRHATERENTPNTMVFIYIFISFTSSL